MQPTAPAASSGHILRSAPRIALSLFLLLPAGALHAQGTGSVRGTVRDSAGRPVPRAEVTLAGSPLRTTADSSGVFRLERVPAGDQRVRARRIGYRLRELPASVSAGGEDTLAFVLAVLARELDPVVVEATLDRRARYLAGFYERKRLGVGRFLTQDRLDARPAMSLPQILASELSGVRIVSTRFVNQGIRFRGNACAPLVWLDGTPTPAAEFDLSAIPPQSVSAVEVYAGPSTVPGEFQMSRGLHACGVIVVWSRMWDERREPRRSKRAPSLDSALAQLKVYTADEVDQSARVDSAKLVTPAYPDSLYAFRVVGEVVAEFIVDTTGEAREGSFGVVSTTHPLFGEAVRRAVMSSRFTPARHRGALVPQVMVLPFRFQLGGDDER